MIEILLANKLNSISPNVYASKLPEKAAKPAAVYSVQGFKKHKELYKSRHYSTNFQVNVFADTYKQAKQLQSQILDDFDEYDAVIELDGKKFSITTEVTNIVDLFNINANQIAIDIQVEYIIS
ncbi:minor capsid protein [Vibrio fortis]|uniref:phage tail terminator protein n=1 Tax=Vibrio fortis TaxID=212667 RepID=UPI0038CD5CC8